MGKLEGDVRLGAFFLRWSLLGIIFDENRELLVFLNFVFMLIEKQSDSEEKQMIGKRRRQL